MIETLEKEINGSKYSVTQLPARRALKLQAKLAKILGPCCSEIFIAAGKDVDSADSIIPKAISLLLDKIDDKTFDEFVVEMLQGVRKSGIELTASTVDLEFAGNLNELFLVLKFVLEANFSDFFSGGGILSSLLNLQKTKM